MANHAVEERKMAASMLGSSIEPSIVPDGVSSDLAELLGVDHSPFTDDGSMLDFSKVRYPIIVSVLPDFVF